MTTDETRDWLKAERRLAEQGRALRTLICRGAPSKVGKLLDQLRDDSSAEWNVLDLDLAQPGVSLDASLLDLAGSYTAAKRQMWIEDRLPLLATLTTQRGLLVIVRNLHRGSPSELAAIYMTASHCLRHGMRVLFVAGGAASSVGKAGSAYPDLEMFGRIVEV